MSPAMIVRLLVMLALTSCSGGPLGGGDNAVEASGGAGQASLETQQACRQRVNEMVDKQNRPEIYAANSSLDSPFSANFQPSVPSRGLSGQFAYERTLNQCEHNTGPAVDTGGSVPVITQPTTKGP